MGTRSHRPRTWDYSKHLDHLTEPFYPADPTRQRGSGGIGLGLYLGRTIAEAHGSSLRIHSNPGAGTRLRVAIPMPKEAWS